MTRKASLALGVALVTLTGFWLGPRLAPEARWQAGGSRVAVAADTLEDLMLDLQIIPLDSRPAQAFTLETLDGKRLALADLAGRAVLLYFWATW
jgi:hypothetical protein